MRPQSVQYCQYENEGRGAGASPHIVHVERVRCQDSGPRLTYQGDYRCRHHPCGSGSRFLCLLLVVRVVAIVNISGGV